MDPFSFDIYDSSSSEDDHDSSSSEDDHDKVTRRNFEFLTTVVTACLGMDLRSTRSYSKRFCGEVTMDTQIQDETISSPTVKATLCLGSETHTIEACKGILSDQLVYLKGESMNILKEFITKHNVPNDVPDEITSEDDDDDDDGVGPTVKSKKIKT